MSKKIQLSIPKPCHEDWEKMSPDDKGKFCGSCQKQVVDFSSMSDRQVAEFFKKPSTGSVCGRFMNDQLDREISIPKKRVPFLKYFFQILIPAFFMAKTSAQKIGKVAVRPVVTADSSKPQHRPTMGMIARPAQPDKEKYRTITGLVTDELGNPISYASVMIKNTDRGVATNDLGKYQVKVKSGDVLLISSVGFSRGELTVGEGNFFTTSLASLTLKGEVVTVTAGMVVCTKPENKPAPKFTTGGQDNSSKNFKIFPNPLRAGEQLTIDYKRLSQGPYQMQWLDQSGQLIHEQPFSVEAKSGSYRTTVPVIIAGSYFIVLLEKRTGKQYTGKIIIQ